MCTYGISHVTNDGKGRRRSASRRVPTAQRDANMTLAELIQGAPERNVSLLERVKPTGDDWLDDAAWTKSKKEFDAKPLLGPYDSLEDIPRQNPLDPAAIIPRSPISEQHGGASEPSARNIDDMLVTDAVSHPARFASNELGPWNVEAMSVT